MVGFGGGVVGAHAESQVSLEDVELVTPDASLLPEPEAPLVAGVVLHPRDGRDVADPAAAGLAADADCVALIGQVGGFKVGRITDHRITVRVIQSSYSWHQFRSRSSES